MEDLNLMTTEEVAKVLRVHAETIRRYIREGRIEAVRVGKQWCIEPKSIKKFVGNCHTTDNEINNKTNKTEK